MVKRRFGSFEDDLNRMMMRESGTFTMRQPERYTDISLSVQASTFHYCSPRKNDLPLDAYESVEVGFLYRGRLARPSAAGIVGFDDLFEEGGSPVAGFVSQADVTRLRNAIRLAGGEA